MSEQSAERFFSAEQKRITLRRSRRYFTKSLKVTGNSISSVDGEGVKAELVFQTRHDYCEAERVEAGLEQHEVVRQRRQMLFLLFGDGFELGNYLRSYGHPVDAQCCTRALPSSRMANGKSFTR